MTMHTTHKLLKKTKTAAAITTFATASFGAYWLSNKEKETERSYPRGSLEEAAWLKTLPELGSFQRQYATLWDKGFAADFHRQEFLEETCIPLNTHPGLKNTDVNLPMLFNGVDEDYFDKNGALTEKVRKKLKSQIDSYYYTIIRYRNDSKNINLNFESTDSKQIEEFFLNSLYQKENILLLSSFPDWNESWRKDPWNQGEILRLKSRYEERFLSEKSGGSVTLRSFFRFQDRQTEIQAREALLDSEVGDLVLNSIRLYVYENSMESSLRAADKKRRGLFALKLITWSAVSAGVLYFLSLPLRRMLSYSSDQSDFHQVLNQQKRPGHAQGPGSLGS